MHSVMFTKVHVEALRILAEVEGDLSDPPLSLEPDV